MTMYRRILVGYDGSDSSRKAVETACQLAERDGAELWVLSVARPPEFGDDVEVEAVMENSRRHYQSLLDKLRAGMPTGRLKAHFQVAVGHPAQQIIYGADRNDVDLIVVGDRGHSKVAQLLMGSVSKAVAQHADRQVLIVR
jgi:nucleotide-binding universal stress UspA family protein